MFIAKVPLRISFFGGGTDIPFFYNQNNYGCVISTTINKYIYITLKNHGSLFNEKYRMNYSLSETTNNIELIKNDIFRNVIKYFKLNSSTYISTISDIPSSSGLGSSSALVVGLFLILNKKNNLKIPRKKLVNDASEFEIKQVSESIGKQDHYATFYGGFNFIKFNRNKKVSVKKINKIKLLNKIESNSLFFWTGIQRSANKILKSQNYNDTKSNEILLEIRKIAEDIYYRFKNDVLNIEDFGKSLHETWLLKKKMSKMISNKNFDELYRKCRDLGAIGGKILGAGGGGFLYILASKNNHKKIIYEMNKSGLIYEKIKFNQDSAKIIYSD